MNRAYWDDLAEAFDERVLQVTEHDTGEVLRSTARRLQGRRKRAIDFGCGIGAVTRAVAPHFGTTIGVDYSPKLVARARRLTRRRSVEYRCANLARPLDGLPAADVGFCVNVLIHRRADLRRRIGASVVAGVRRGGRLVLVVPAFESALRTYQTVLRCQVEAGAPRAPAVRRLDRLARREVTSVTDGIVEVGASPTKHYLHDELVEFVEALGVRVDTVRRVEFPWSVEIDDPPEGLHGPTPWDWLVEGIVG